MSVHAYLAYYIGSASDVVTPILAVLTIWVFVSALCNIWKFNKSYRSAMTDETETTQPIRRSRDRFMCGPRMCGA